MWNNQPGVDLPNNHAGKLCLVCKVATALRSRVGRTNHDGISRTLAIGPLVKCLNPFNESPYSTLGDKQLVEHL